MVNVKYLLDVIYSQDNIDRINQSKKRYEIYNGRLREIVKSAIQKEFIMPETVAEMINRIIPINVTQKIINKLAGVYLEAPVREAKDGNEADTEAVEMLSDEMQLDRNFKLANRYFKLFKNVLIEYYLNSEGCPSMRPLPDHTYTLISSDTIEPNKPTGYIKHIEFTGNKENDLHTFWDGENHFTFDGKGNIIIDPENPELINPYGEAPFIYVNESADLLQPIQDDDLISVQIAICLLLTDLAFASKYQAWSIIYLIGAETEKLSFNPSSVISLGYNQDGLKPEIGTIKPTLDSDAMLRQVEALVSLLLTTKNLSVNAVSATGINAQNAASGVAKILDQSESTEDRTDQIAYFAEAEKESFELIAEYMMPAWIASGKMKPEYAHVFSPEFELTISYPEMGVKLSESEQVDVEIKKLDAGLTSKSMSIKALNPEYTQDEVNQVLIDIEKEKAAEMDVAANPEMISTIDGTESQT